MSGTDPAADEPSDADDEVDRSHLDDVDDGCGCAEVWEYLSETRQSEREKSS